MDTSVAEKTSIKLVNDATSFLLELGQAHLSAPGSVHCPSYSVYAATWFATSEPATLSMKYMVMSIPADTPLEVKMLPSCISTHALVARALPAECQLSSGHASMCGATLLVDQLPVGWNVMRTCHHKGALHGLAYGDSPDVTSTQRARFTHVVLSD